VYIFIEMKLIEIIMLTETFVVAYLASTDTMTDLLTYWENKSLLWPKLGQVARGLLGIPAASTSSERVFSTAGWTVDEQRTSLSGDSVDGLMFFHGLI